MNSPLHINCNCSMDYIDRELVNIHGEITTCSKIVNCVLNHNTSSNLLDEDMDKRVTPMSELIIDKSTNFSCTNRIVKLKIIAFKITDILLDTIEFYGDYAENDFNKHLNKYAGKVTAENIERYIIETADKFGFVLERDLGFIMSTRFFIGRPGSNSYEKYERINKLLYGDRYNPPTIYNKELSVIELFNYDDKFKIKYTLCSHDISLIPRNILTKIRPSHKYIQGGNNGRRNKTN